MEKQGTPEVLTSDSEAADEFKILTDAKTIMELTDKCDTWGIIASFSPFVTDFDNIVRWARLKKEVSGMKLDYEQFVSGYRYPEKEKMTKIQQKLLFIPGIKLYPLLLLGYRYQQATVIHGSRMGAIAYNVESTKPEITVTKSEMLTAWTSLLTLPGTYIMGDNPNDVSIHRSKASVERFRTFESHNPAVKFSEPAKSADENIKKIWEVIDSGEFFGVISAYQPGISILTLEEFHKFLKQDLAEKGYKFYEQSYEYNFCGSEGMTLQSRKSLFVPGLPYEELIEFGKKFEQETVTFGGNGGVTMVRVSDQKVLMDMTVDSMKLAWNFLLTNQRTIPW